MRFLLLFILLLPAVVSATTATEDATADAIAHENEPDNNYGNSEYIGVIMQSGMLAATCIKFDVTAYMGQTLNSATLYAYCWLNDATNATIWFGAVAQPWNEMSITWNNFPPIIGGTNESTTYPSGTGWWSCDVTSIVQNWLNSAYSNNGLAFYDVDGSYAKVYFNSREYASDNPYLELNYGTGIESESLGGIKAVFR